MRRRRSHLDPQLTFGYVRREGHRVGRPKKPGAGMRHGARDALSSRYPVHVVLKLARGLPRLRTKRPYKVLRRCFAKGCDRFGFRLVHYSVQGDHLHLIVEAKDRKALSSGMGGLAIRIARGLNKLWSRKGKVFADRYYDHILRTPMEVKRALAYVFHNRDKHREYELDRDEIDIFSSGMWFDGWREKTVNEIGFQVPPPLARSRTWLLKTGWRRHGLLSLAG